MSSENVSARFPSSANNLLQVRGNPGGGFPRRFSATTDDGLFFVPGEYRLSGETRCYPWLDLKTGLCIVTENTGFASGVYDVKGIVKYDSEEELNTLNPKHAKRLWSRKDVRGGDHYSGRLLCEPVELMAPPVKMVDDPRSGEPNSTHEYNMTGFTLVKKRRSDVPGLTVVVNEMMPARKRYLVEGRVLCQVGSNDLHGVSRTPLQRTNIGRFRLNGQVHLSLCTDEDTQQPASQAPPPPPPDEEGRPPQATGFHAETCRCRPVTR